MYKRIFFSFLLVFFMQYSFAGENEIETMARDLAQQQLDAYNKGDIEAFLEPYSEDVEIYTFPDKLQMKGKEQMRARYAAKFKKYPKLHCKLLNRIVKGNTAIDHEEISGVLENETYMALAIYTIKDGKIAKVYFVKDE